MKQNKKVTRVAFILDRSGSMQPVIRQAIKAVNDNISTIRESVKEYKQVMIVSKANGKVYSGDAARQMLGLPKHETKIRPGDNGDFDLFVQSTSTNRKLAEGTRVIYVK